MRIEDQLKQLRDKHQSNLDNLKQKLQEKQKPKQQILNETKIFLEQVEDLNLNIPAIMEIFGDLKNRSIFEDERKTRLNQNIIAGTEFQIKMSDFVRQIRREDMALEDIEKDIEFEQNNIDKFDEKLKTFKKPVKKEKILKDEIEL